LNKTTEVIKYLAVVFKYFCFTVVSGILSPPLSSVIHIRDIQNGYLMILFYSSSSMQVQLSKADLKINFTLKISHFPLGTFFF